MSSSFLSAAALVKVVTEGIVNGSLAFLLGQPKSIATNIGQT